MTWADRLPGAGRALSSSLLGPPPSERRLSDLASEIPGAEIRGDGSSGIAGLAYRWQDASDGVLFFCVPGAERDGHAFAGDAVERGARALVVERWASLDVAQVRVPSVREAMGPISAHFYGRPAESITIVGVTGTNGKTTTTYLLESIFRRAGRIPGVVGTTGVRVAGRAIAFPRTTPEAPDLHRVLRQMVDEGVETVAMEVSSHGLDQHRVDGIRFDCAVFTNLSQDHLDYHPSMEAYLSAKARLFTPAMARRAVVNLESPEGRRLLTTGVPTTTFGLGPDADVRAEDVGVTAEGIAFRVGGTRVRSPLRGAFNVENCLAAFAGATAIGIPADDVAGGIADLAGVPGRLEVVPAGLDGPLVVVDYAHTPESLRNVLTAARPLAEGRLIVVFGAGGDRDRAKRPLMGRVAASTADLTVVTSDNPRSEDPSAIVAEIEPGARDGGGRYLIEVDRRSAIRLALGEARRGDVVVIAGKGHETYQELADRTIDFDDRTVAGEELRALGSSR
jgi:UDP-N-acetylmuramoyl-L-alanyl-D-glutamate--2,6-diaminopimelate ligase